MSAVATAASAHEPTDTGCNGGESFALRVLGSDMAPEFNDGDIVIIEPDGALVHGCYVLAQIDGEWLLRQLCRSGPGWLLRTLHDGAADATALVAQPTLPAHPAASDVSLPDLAVIRGRVIQKAVPGRRRLSKSYL